MVAGLEAECFADPSVDFASGLGFTPAPADVQELADQLNRVPGGLGCLANGEVGITTPLAKALIGDLTPYDGHCVAADLPADLYARACFSDTDCGKQSGRCGQLAYVLKEGGSGLSDCRSCMPGTSRVGGACERCAPGGYSDVVDAASCTACAPRLFQYRPGRLVLRAVPGREVSGGCRPHRVL